MDLLIGNIFRRNAEHVPDHVAASMGERTLSHAQLDADSNRIAHALRAEGIGYGDRVVTWADTSLAVLPLFAAIAKLGAVFAPLNARFGADEAADVARLARASLFVADGARADDGEKVAEKLGVAHFARLDGGSGAGLSLDPTTLGASSEDIDTPELREKDPHVIFFTSGSTGRPKGVVLSHRTNWLRAFQGVFRDAPERSICMFPFFHMGAFTLALTAWQTRGEIGLVQNATADEILAAVERRRGNRLYCIPAVWARILETPVDAYDTSSLREIDTGTSATPIELIRALKARFPATVTRIYYGSTESGSGTTLPDADVLRKPGSAGLPSPSVELRLSGRGEIQIRSPFLMDGYFDDPEATAATIQDGWYQTGDLGELDAEGYLSVVGRLKEIIRTGGESVAPGEVEAALGDHPDVAEIAVVGVPDAEWGEVVCAVVVPQPGRTPDLASLQKHCERTLAGFKKPRRLECVAEFPRTAATGQVQRRLLVERIVSA